MESTRKEMRSVFDPDRWEVHRSTARYYRHMSAIPKSRILRGLTKPLLYVLSVATAVAAYETTQQMGIFPFLPDISIKSKELFGLTSFALSLLLVFRTNSSYGRWDEARKMWGLVLNRSRDIVRQGLVWIPQDKPHLREMLCRWVPAFSKCLMCHLRKGDDLKLELETVGLLPHEVEAVLASAHRPNYALQVIGTIISEAKMPTPPTLVMDMNVTVFEDCLGGCERILRTPIPLEYTRHTTRFLMIWLTLLPFSLWPTMEWGSVPMAGLIAFLLLGVEKIGVSVEEPFSILALEAISNTAFTNVKELKATHDAQQSSESMTSAADMVLLSMMEAQQAKAVAC